VAGLVRNDPPFNPILIDHYQGRGFTSSPLFILRAWRLNIAARVNERCENLLANSIAMTFLLVGICWFSHDMIWNAEVPFFRDLGPYFYPIRFSLAQSLSAGELPLWDRNMGMGFPLLADFQSAPFYPPHLVFLFVSFFDAIRILFVFHYLVSALGAYTLGRQWGYPPYLSVIAAFLFTFGGIIVSLTNVLNHFQAAVWLPWLILAGQRAIRSYSGKDLLMFSGVALIQFLAGSPELYAISLGLLYISMVAAAKQSKAVSYLKPFSLIIAANILVAGISMVQLLPTVELFLESRRPSNIPYSEATAWSLRPLSLINFFILDKEVDRSLFNGVRLFFGRDIPFLVSLYMGQLCVFGLCSWFYYARRKNKYMVAALILIGLMVALGRHTFIYSYLVAYAPFFTLFRFPEKFVFFIYPLVILITTEGLSTFIESRNGGHRIPLLIFGSISLSLVLLYLLCRFQIDYFIAFLRWYSLAPTELILDIFPRWLFSLERQILLLGAMFLLLLLYKLEKVSFSIFRIFIVALVFVDLTSAHRQFQFLVKSELVTDKPKIISTSGSQRYRLFSGLPSLHPSIFTMRDRSFPEVAEAVWSSLVPNIGVFYDVDYLQEIDALSRTPYDVFLKTAKNLPPGKFYPLLGALNVKYITSFSPLPDGDIELVRHFPEYPLWLYVFEEAVPRVYVVSAAEHETDQGKTLERLASKDFDPLATVLVDEPMSFGNTAGFQAEARILEYENHRVNIQASLDSPGILVLADSFYPGWNAYVNGRQEKIYRANLFFRGVRLSAGTHTVQFRYEPRSFAIGRAVSIITLLFIVAISILLYLRKHRQNLTAAAC
jgi:Bacterial membrane protein YfhO